MNRDGTSEVRDILIAQKQFFKSGRTQDLDYRLENLSRLKTGIIQKESAVLEALKKDLSRAPYESYLLEVGVLLAEIQLVLRRLKSWARPRRARA